MYKNKNSLCAVFISRADIIHVNQMDALASLSLLNVPWGLLESWFSLKTKAAITTPRLYTLASCVNTDPKHCCTPESCTLSACCDKVQLNVFSSVHVYIQRTWQPASFSFMVISCYRPSFLNITLEFHLKGRKHWECENVVCLMNKTGEKCLNGCINALFFCHRPSVHIVHNIKHDLILALFP